MLTVIVNLTSRLRVYQFSCGGLCVLSSTEWGKWEVVIGRFKRDKSWEISTSVHFHLCYCDST